MEDKDFIIENGVLIAYNGANETVIVPDGITAIGEIAFEWNETLKEVILPQSLQEIGFFAFRGCKNLTVINIPRNVKTIHKTAFLGALLKTIIIEEGNGAYTIADGYLIDTRTNERIYQLTA